MWENNFTHTPESNLKWKGNLISPSSLLLPPPNKLKQEAEWETLENAEGQYKLNKFKQLKKPFFNKLLKNTY